jgi:hypothetical protein
VSSWRTKERNVPERWVNELRKLRETEPPREIWDRALRGPAIPEAADNGRRWLAVAVAAVVFLAGGTFAWLALAPHGSDRGLGMPDGLETPVIPDVARVVCTRRGTVVLTPVVRAHRDGLHLVFDNRSGASQFFFPDPGSVDGIEVSGGHGGTLRPGLSSKGTFAPPGTVVVGCFRGSQSPYRPKDNAYARFRLVDPRGYWAPTGPGCSHALRSRARRHGSADDLEAIVRRMVGVRPTDEIRHPGYPDAPLMVEARVVLREGRAVARMTFWGPRDGEGDFKIWVDACPGSGIGNAR